jgi:hypothetical protein
MYKFSQLGFSVLKSKKDRTIITSIINQSLAALRTTEQFDAHRFGDIVETFRQAYPITTKVTERDRFRIYNLLRDENFGNTPISALAATSISGIAESEEKFERIRAWTFLVTLGNASNGASTEQLKPLCARIRLLATPQYFELLRALPKFGCGLVQTYSELEQLRENYSALENNILSARIAEIQGPIFSFLHNRDWLEVDHIKKNRVTSKQNLIVFPDSPHQNFDDFKYQEFTADHVSPLPGVPTMELVADNVSDYRLVQLLHKTPSKLRSENGLDYFLNRQAASSIIIRELKPLVSVSQATEFEAATLCAEIFQMNFPKIENTALAISFFYGRSIEQSVRLIIGKGSSGRDKIIISDKIKAFSHKPDLPKPRYNVHVQNFIEYHDDTLFLSLPQRLAEQIRSIRKTKRYVLKEICENAKRRIIVINQKHKTRLTMTKISQYLSFILSKTSISPVHQALICGISQLHKPSLYYRVASSLAINLQFQRQLNERFRNTEFKFSRISDFHVKLGTQLVTQDRFVKKLFESYARLFKDKLGGYKAMLAVSKSEHSIEHLEKDSPQRNDGKALPLIYDFHNSYVCYVYLLLSLSTGHRPIVAPFESIEDFDSILQRVLICDKVNRDGYTSRVIPINDVAIKQVDYYLQHLKTLKNLLQTIDDQNVNVIKKAIDGTSSLLFLFKNKHGKPTACNIGPKRIATHIGVFWPLPYNWNRHYMANALEQSGLDGELIDVFMGHESFGQESSGRYSQYNEVHSEKIRWYVSKVLEKLNIRPIRGL